MRYENAGTLLPPDLLKQVQRYASGTLLYVPAAEAEKPRREPTGHQRWLQKRNQIILNSFRYGESMQQLAEEHFLSVETIRKIVYSKKNTEELRFRPDTGSAEAYASAGLLEEWSYTLMAFERGHRKFADRLYQHEQCYFGPVVLPLSLVQRNTGPETGMRFQISREVFERDVLHWTTLANAGQALPPILIGFENGAFVVNCFNAMLEALHRRHIKEFPFVIRVEATDLPALQRAYPALCKN